MKTKCMSCGSSMKKMAVGGTTTKRIIKKSTGGMYGIPQENLGTSGQYGFAQKGGVIKAVKKVVKKITRPTLRKAQKGIQVNATSTNPALDYDKQMLAKQQYENMRIRSKEIEAKRKEEARTKMTNKFKTDSLNEYMRDNPITPKKKGGATKATKFAALAPPYNKATFADKIVGAKKSAGSKKLPKAQFGAFIKAFSKVVKPVTKIVKPASKIVKPVAKRVATTSKKNIPKKIDFRNTKNSMERMMGSKQIQNYFKKSTQRDNLLNLVNKNKN